MIQREESSNPIKKKEQKTNIIKDMLGPLPLDLTAYGFKAMMNGGENGERKVAHPVSISLWRNKKQDSTVEPFTQRKPTRPAKISPKGNPPSSPTTITCTNFFTYSSSTFSHSGLTSVTISIIHSRQ